MKKYLLMALISIIALSQINLIYGQKETQPKTEQKAKPKLDDNEDPEKIGKRDINKHQIDFYSLEKEVALGRQLAQQMEQQGVKLVDDPIITEYINRLGQNIVLHSDAKVPFTIKVIASDEINAFALPGGFFYVNTGLIMTADNEAELAGVMAHEIAHVAARHAVENASKGELLQLLSIPLIFVGGGIGTLGRLGANFGLPMAFLKFSRSAESEADMLGAEYAWATGYDPHELITFFDKLQAKNKKKPGAIAKVFMTHPPPRDRQEKLEKLMQKFPDKEEYVVNSSEFGKVKERLARFVSVPVKPGDKSQGSGRPTLRRKVPGPDEPDQTKPDADKTEQNKDKKEPPPTLKRKRSEDRP